MKNQPYLSDEELITMIRSGDQNAYQILFDRHMKRFHSHLAMYITNKSSNFSEDDLLVIYVSTLNSAISTYRNFIISFSSYLAQLVMHNFNNYLRSMVTSNDAMYKRISIFDSESSEEENNEYFDTISASDYNRDEVKDFVNATDSALILSNYIDRKLPGRRSEMVKEICELKIQGYSQREIAEKLGVETSVVVRIIGKLKKVKARFEDDDKIIF